MRTGLSCLLLASLIQAGLAVKFSGEKVKLGKAKCTCDFNIKPGPPCGGTAKCDKKCSGKGSVSVEGFEFNLQCKKGNVQFLDVKLKLNLQLDQDLNQEQRDQAQNHCQLLGQDLVKCRFQ
eukprot:TRINITY_DN270_c0_g1_i20.p1 TRINITY_DN270_c0_g1~~TRINITY_DN270_c0_g1_i20.p1  ORF type:complete len:121 (-),score=38.46 TRINITY_DN270_c0_g1_i20:81-443(-)